LKDLEPLWWGGAPLHEKIFIQNIDDIFRWIHYCCCCIFLTISCHVIFKVGATISHRIFFSHYFWKNKTSRKNYKITFTLQCKSLTCTTSAKFCHHYFIIGLQFSNSIPKFEHFTNKKNRKWNWDKGWIGYGTREDFVNSFNITTTFKGFFELKKNHTTRSSIIITCQCLMSII